MKPIPVPVNEALRLKELYSYNILDTEKEVDFDQLVELASLICECAISVVTLIDKDRQWFKARIGIDACETTRDVSFCTHTILQDDLMVVENALEDERFRDNPNVTGEPFIRFYAGAPIISENGFNLGTICVVDDKPHKLTRYQEESLRRLSRQAALLLELRKKNAQLEQFAAEQKRLREEAEQASRAKEQFLSTMSHEIRTPLNAVIGMTDLLLADKPQPHQLEYLHSLQFSSQNLLSIVNDILDYNKITSGKIVLDRSDFNLHKLLLELKKAHAVKAAEKGIGLEVLIDPEVPARVSSDATRLTQILNNLIGNAVKFTSEGSVRVHLTQKNRTEEHTTVLFEVIDTGIGIEEEKIGVIFEQFSQANAGITRMFGGTGLGLAITKKLLELLGGTVSVASRPGQGSCFSFTLKLERSKEFKTSAAVDAPENRSFKGTRVLVVEDNQINILVIRNTLAKWDMEVDYALNGEEGVKQLRNGAYDLVFMDIQMPVMDGLTATRIIREEKLFYGPIIMLTADAFLQANVNLEEIGFSDFLLKPFSQAALYETVTRNTVQCRNTRIAV